MTAPYTAGTISLVSGSAAVVGTDTAWEVSLIIGGTIYVQFDGGNPLPIATVDSDTEITAALNWTGPTGSYSYAIMRDTAYGQQTVANAQALATYIQRLNNPALAAAAGVTPESNKLLLFTGPNTATVIDLEELSGDVVGPSGAVDNFPVAFDGVTGKLIKQINGAIAALHGVAPAADRMPYFDSEDSAALTILSAFARTLLDDPSGAEMFATMGAVIWGDSSNGGVKFPIGSRGLILQWGLVPGMDSAGGANVVYSQAFPNAVFGFYPVILSDYVSGAHSPLVYQSWDWGPTRLSGQTIWCRAGGSPLVAANVRWLALGW